MGEKYVQEEFLGEESLGKKYMGEKYVQEEFLGEESLGEKYMGEKNMDEHGAFVGTMIALNLAICGGILLFKSNYLL